MEKEYIIQFYNRFSCENQIYKIKAINKLKALYKFRERYPYEIYYDCIDFIEEA